MVQDKGDTTALVNMVIWTLRVVFPIILFVLYYRVSIPSAGGFWPFVGKHRRSRDSLLQYRFCGLDEKRPQALANLSLLDHIAAPHLFKPRKGAKGEGKGGAEKGTGKGMPTVPAATSVPSAAPSVTPGQSGPDKSLQHLESLMNYMAFNRKNHRIFHPKEVPPPPSSPPPPPSGEKPALEFQSKANLDAQMVLRGAIAFAKYDVTHDVVDSLVGAKVTPSFDTFLLMVEAMILSNDLPQASEYLMKMEQEGHSPDAMLLDRVMDLYAEYKLNNDVNKKLGSATQEAEQDGLSVDAPEFFPEFNPGTAFLQDLNETEFDMDSAWPEVMPEMWVDNMYGGWDSSWDESGEWEWSWQPDGWQNNSWKSSKYSSWNWENKENGNNWWPSGQGEAPKWNQWSKGDAKQTSWPWKNDEKQELEGDEGQDEKPKENGEAKASPNGSSKSSPKGKGKGKDKDNGTKMIYREKKPKEEQEQKVWVKKA